MRVGFRALRRLVALTLLASLFAGLMPASASALTERQIRNRLYEKVNKARENHGLKPLRRNDKTQKFAKGHARWMSNNCWLDILPTCHDSLVELGEEVPRDAEEWGENIAITFTSIPRFVSSIHSRFMNSEHHCENILKRRYTHMGFGVVKRNGTVYVVQRFADRRTDHNRLGIHCD